MQKAVFRALYYGRGGGIVQRAHAYYYKPVLNPLLVGLMLRWTLMMGSPVFIITEEPLHNVNSPLMCGDCERGRN